MPQGRHVKVLGRGASDLLGSGKAVETMLRELVELLGMRLLGAPHLYEVETEIAKLGVEPFEDEGGVTGVCVLSTSHCSIHTWPLRPFFVMDVYSCRDFDPALVEQHLAKSLGAYDVQVTDVSFALEYGFAQARSPSRSAPKMGGRHGLRGWSSKRAG
jgi:S-adenosylmethionine/arginine decarboxylase-like enzyme